MRCWGSGIRGWDYEKKEGLKDRRLGSYEARRLGGYEAGKMEDR